VKEEGEEDLFPYLRYRAVSSDFQLLWLPFFHQKRGRQSTPPPFQFPVAAKALWPGYYPALLKIDLGPSTYVF
jgi:hypothetical protein